MMNDEFVVLWHIHINALRAKYGARCLFMDIFSLREKLMVSKGLEW